MPFAQLSQVRLHYYESGEGAQPLLLVHGYQASGRIWELVRTEFPGDLYRCIAPDNRGAGQSDAPEGEDAYGCGPFAGDLYELVQALGLERVVMVGHSMGGATAMQYAVRHPETLRALVLVDPAGPDGLGTPGDVETAVDRSTAARRAQLESGRPLVDAGTGTLPPEFARALDADMRAAPETRLRGSMRSMLTIRIGEEVSRLPVPVLLVAGDQDKTVPIDRILDTYRRLPPGSGLHVWHGVGHSPNIETPMRFTRVLRKFLEYTLPRMEAERAVEGLSHKV